MVSEQLSQAVALIRAKDYVRATDLLWEVLDDDPTNADAYYWLSMATDDSNEKRGFLEQALYAEPNHVMAKSALTRLNTKSAATFPTQSDPAGLPPPSSDPAVSLPPLSTESDTSLTAGYGSDDRTETTIDPNTGTVTLDISSVSATFDPGAIQLERSSTQAVVDLSQSTPEPLEPCRFESDPAETHLEESEHLTTVSSDNAVTEPAALPSMHAVDAEPDLAPFDHELQEPSTNHHTEQHAVSDTPSDPEISVTQGSQHKTTARWQQLYPDERAAVADFLANVTELRQLASSLTSQGDQINSLNFAVRKYEEFHGQTGNSGVYLAPAIKAAAKIADGLLAVERYGDAFWAANIFGELAKIQVARNHDNYIETFEDLVLAACRACSGNWQVTHSTSNSHDDNPGEIGMLRDRLLTICQFALGTIFRTNQGCYTRNYQPDEGLRDWAVNRTLAEHFDRRLRQLLVQDRPRIGEYVRVNLPFVYKLQLPSSWDARTREWEKLLVASGYNDLLEDLRSRGELVRVDRFGVLPPERLEDLRRAASSSDMKRVRELLRDNAEEVKYYLFNEAQRRLDYRQPRPPTLPDKLNGQFAVVRRVTPRTSTKDLQEALRVARDVWAQDIDNIVLRDWVAYLLARTANIPSAEQMFGQIRQSRPARENFFTDWNLAVLQYQKGAEKEAYQLLLPLLNISSTDQDLIMVVLALALKLGDREHFLSLVPQTMSLQYHVLAIIVALDLNDRKRVDDLLGQFLRQGEEQWKLPPLSAQFRNLEALQGVVNRAIVEGQVDQLVTWLRGRIDQQRRWVPNHMELARVLEQERQDIDGAFGSLLTVLDIEKHHSPRNQRYIDDAARALLEFCKRHKRADLGERSYKAAEAATCSEDVLTSFSIYRILANDEPTLTKVSPPEPPLATELHRPLPFDPALTDRVIWVNARLTTIQKARQYVDESRAIDELCAIISQISPEARDTLVKLIQDTSAVIEVFERTPREDREVRRYNYDRASNFERRLSTFLTGNLPSNLADVLAPYHRALRTVLGGMSKDAGIGPNVQATLLNEFISLEPSQSMLVLQVSNESDRIATNVSVDLSLDTSVLRLAERRPRTIASLDAHNGVLSGQVLTFGIERNLSVATANVREVGVNISLLASAEGFPDHDLGVIQRSIPVKTLREAIGQDMIPRLFKPGLSLNPQEPALFKGRDDILKRIGSTFNGGVQRGRFFLDGIRRVGKTSILNFLPTCLPSSVAPIPINLEYLAVPNIGVTSTLLLHRFSELIAQNAKVVGCADCTVPDRARFEDSPGSAFMTFISILRGGFGDRIPLLMIDELQLLLQAVQRCGVGRDQDTLVLDLLRGAMDDGLIMGIFTGSVRYERLTSIVQHRIIGSLDRLRISFLDYDNVAAVLHAGLDPWAKLPDATIQRVYELTGGYPRLLQIYGAALVDLMNKEHRTVASPADLDAITNEDVLTNDELFSHWWPPSQLGQDEMLVVETLFRNYPDRPVVGMREFLDAVNYRDKPRFSEALTNLRACEVLDSTRPDQLRFTGVVLRQWLQNQILDGHLRIRRAEPGGSPDTGQAGLFIDHENLVKSLERISRSRGVTVPLQNDGVARLNWFRPVLERLYKEAERRLGRLDYRIAVAFWDRSHEAVLTPPYQKLDFLNKSPQAVNKANASDFKLADEVAGAVSAALMQNTRLARAIVITGDGDLSQSIHSLVNRGVSVQVWGGARETNLIYSNIVGEANVVALDDVCGL
jgi:hypothetical protein